MVVAYVQVQSSGGTEQNTELLVSLCLLTRLRSEEVISVVHDTDITAELTSVAQIYTVTSLSGTVRRLEDCVHAA
jgi:hypothetical protein